MNAIFATDDRVNLSDAVMSRRDELAALLEEFGEPRVAGALACIDGKDGDRSNPYDRWDEPDSWDEFRRGYEAESTLPDTPMQKQRAVA